MNSRYELPVQVVLKLARQLSQHAEARAAVRVQDGVRVYEVHIEGGRIQIRVLEGESIAAASSDFSVLDLSEEHAAIFSRAYDAWRQLQARLYKLRSVIWE